MADDLGLASTPASLISDDLGLASTASTLMADDLILHLAVAIES